MGSAVCFKDLCFELGLKLNTFARKRHDAVVVYSPWASCGISGNFNLPPNGAHACAICIGYPDHVARFIIGLHSKPSNNFISYSAVLLIPSKGNTNALPAHLFNA